MTLKMAMWVHGTVAEVEDPGGLAPNGILHDGMGTHFFGGSKSFHWIHVPVPTPVVIDGSRPSLATVFVLFNAFGCRIKHVDIWDGPFRSKEIHLLDLTLAGDHSAGIDPHNSFEIVPPLTVRFGLKVAIGVQFSALVDPEPNLKAEFLVTAAGADFRD